MYIAAVRIAAEFGCATVGIQYQQGLKDLAPASDLVEGLLNNVNRPARLRRDHRQGTLSRARRCRTSTKSTKCAGLDGVVTYKLWRELGYAPENTLHDLRWGRPYKDKNLDAYVWVFLISGAVPPAHLIGGYKGTSSERQPAMYFRLGGGTVKGISKPGWIVWSRVFVADGKLKFDTGLAEVVKLPRRGNAGPLEPHHEAMADHARRAPGHFPRPDDGAPQEQPHPGRLRPRQGRGEERPLRESHRDGRTRP